ncbi:MAG: hypothetical protein V8Q75_05610 [Bacilli bacterium]
MNRKFSILNLFCTLIIFIIMLIFYRQIWLINFSKLLLVSLILLILIIISFIQLRNKNKILDNCKYNLMLLFCNIVTFIIILRDFFDNYMVMNSAGAAVTTFGFDSTGSMYIDYNLIFILIMYLGVLIFNIINSIKKNF